jgi:hypothetical protein
MDIPSENRRMVEWKSVGENQGQSRGPTVDEREIGWVADRMMDEL